MIIKVLRTFYMQISFNKQFHIVIEPGDLVRLFRILDHLKDIKTDTDIRNDALILLDELSDLHEVVQQLSEAKSVKADLNVLATYIRNSDTISLGDIIIPGETLPEVEPLDVDMAAPPLTEYVGMERGSIDEAKAHASLIRHTEFGF
jgi:hypothetical protein